MKQESIVDIMEIFKLLPHRYPFLLVDRVIELKLGESLVAIKNVTVNEPFFTGHFPSKPVMPGVLILEALAQAGGILLYKSLGQSVKDGTLLLLAGVDNARFKRVVEPGDQLRLEVNFNRSKGKIWKIVARALVGDELACSAELICAVEKMEL